MDGILLSSVFIHLFTLIYAGVHANITCSLWQLQSLEDQTYNHFVVNVTGDKQHPFKLSAFERHFQYEMSDMANASILTEKADISQCLNMCHNEVRCLSLLHLHGNCSLLNWYPRVPAYPVQDQESFLFVRSWHTIDVTGYLDPSCAAFTTSVRLVWKMVRVINVTSTATGHELTTSSENTETNGNKSVACKEATAASGNRTVACNETAAVEGNQTTACNETAAVEGNQTTACNETAAVEGNQTTACNETTAVEGNQTTACNETAAVEGNQTTASNETAAVEGNQTTACNETTAVEGNQTTASNETAAVEGNQTTACNKTAAVEGNQTTACNGSAAVEGNQTTACNESAAVEGNQNSVSDGISVTSGNFVTDGEPTILMESIICTGTSSNNEIEAMNKTVTLNETTALNETAAINETSALNETMSLNERATLNVTAALNETAALIETTAMNENVAINQTERNEEIVATNKINSGNYSTGDADDRICVNKELNTENSSTIWWWTVDLGEVYSLVQVIWLSDKMPSHFEVLAGVTESDVKTLCGSHEGGSPERTSMEINCGPLTVGRYVKFLERAPDGRDNSDTDLNLRGVTFKVTG